MHEVLHDRLPDLLRTFDLGAGAGLSPHPVARGRLAEIWQLETDRGRWAVKTTQNPVDEATVAEAAAFQEAARDSGLLVPAIVRTDDGLVLARFANLCVSVQGWIDMLPASIEVDAAELGQVLARLHQVDFAGHTGVDRWYTDPVGATRWQELLRALHDARAPYVDELADLVPGLVSLEGLLGTEPKTLRTCHRDLWADNVRATDAGGLCVFDFDNAGLADPSQELGMVLFEFCSGSPDRAQTLFTAYAGSGGPGRVEGLDEFVMLIAQQGNIVELGCRSWLHASRLEERADLEAWVREFINRPLTTAVINELLAAIS